MPAGACVAVACCLPAPVRRLPAACRRLCGGCLLPAGACAAVGHKPASCSAYTQFFQHDRPENRSKSWIQRYYTHNISRNRLTLMKIGYNRQNLADYTQFSMFLHLIVQNFLCMKWILGLLCPTATHKEKSGPLAGKAPPLARKKSSFNATDTAPSLLRSSYPARSPRGACR